MTLVVLFAAALVLMSAVGLYAALAIDRTTVRSCAMCNSPVHPYAAFHDYSRQAYCSRFCVELAVPRSAAS